ncbi:MAG: hypothetical protein IIB04_00390 [Acidobacteria bacterium]|nr:hypothetical protein [Acidobacteriota bacterium]MCH8985052.1 hypothetical protein [Acidobacteriota bacterium]
MGGGGSPVLAPHIKAATDGRGVVVRLVNAGDETVTAQIGSAHMRILSARRLSLLGEPQAALDIQNGALELSFSPREIMAVELMVE